MCMTVKIGDVDPRVPSLIEQESQKSQVALQSATIMIATPILPAHTACLLTRPRVMKLYIKTRRQCIAMNAIVSTGQSRRG